MTATIKVVFDLTQGQWADLHDNEAPRVEGQPIPLRKNVEWLGADKCELLVGRLPGGMRDSGNAAVVIRANRPDGSVVLIETSCSVFVETAKVMHSLTEAENKAREAMGKAAGPNHH